MRHLFSCGRALRIALVIPVIAFALIAASVDAHAAAWTGNNGATVCTGGPVLMDYNQPGNCNFSGFGNASFLGQFLTPATLIDPSLCTLQETDPTDVLCGHFGMDFTNVRGSVTVRIGFDADNDLDLCVVGSDGAIVNNCSTGTGGSETVTFNVQCTDTRFEAQILPISYPFPGPTALDPATYTGSVAGSLRRCAPTDGNGEGNGHPDEYDHHGKGGGDAYGDDDHEHEHASGDVEERDDDHGHRGKVRYSKHGCDMRSTSIDSITWNDATRTMTVTGFGTVNGVGNVPYVFTMTDNGRGSTDTYNVQSSCSGHGHYTDHSDYRYSHDRH